MPQTPQKASNSATEPNSVLKAAIEEKLTAKFASAAQKKQPAQSGHQSDDLRQEELQLLQLIESCGSETETGYFRYDDWRKFNAGQFNYVDEQTVNHFWKILRIINHGKVVIPTGLIYEISYYFITKHKLPGYSNNSITLKSVINDFLRFNKNNQFVNNFRELSNYPSIQSIQKAYCPTQQKDNHKNIKKRSQKQSKQIDVHNKLFKESKQREQSIRQLTYASIAKELKQCKFTPNISQYKSKRSLPKCDRICHHEHPKPQDQSIEKINKFVARQIDKRIYSGNLSQVPGVQEHIKRAQYSEAQRQRIKRISNKSWVILR